MSYRKIFTKKAVTSKVGALPFTEGILFINAETKNLNLSLTDFEGRIYLASSGGREGFKNTFKKTALASELTMERVIAEGLSRGLKKIHVKCKGFNYCRNVALRYLVNRGGIEILDFEDKTQLPHGGCRPRKPKRN